MKLTTIFAPLLFSVCLVAFANAEAPTVEVCGVQVIREIPGESIVGLYPFNAQQTGTSVALLIQSKDASIIRLDYQASTLESFTDDTGANLLTESKNRNQEGVAPFPKVSKDGKAGLILIRSLGLPNAEANRIIAKGTLSVYVATKHKPVKSEPFELKDCTKQTIGGIEFNVEKAGKPRFGSEPLEVTFRTKDLKITTLAGVRFLDSSDKEIGSRSSGISTIGAKGNYTYDLSYRLKQEVKEKVVVEFDTWTDLEEHQVPFSIASGVGG